MQSSPLWLAYAFAVIANASTQTVLHNFGTPPHGGTPYSNVIRDAKGNLYGTACYGGNSGMGVVYKIAPGGKQTVLHSFSGADGANPQAGVIRDSAGNLYGTTVLGGAAGVGVVYKIDAGGHQAVLYNFTGGLDGAFPYAGVIRDSAGNLYGTTPFGGTAAGTAYKLDPSGHLTVLHSFTGSLDGGNPYAGVARDSAGNLYGTTYYGGSGGYGVIYKIDPTGKQSVLYTFTSSSGAPVYAGVALDSAGNIFGTGSGGPAGGGVVYQLDPGGTYSILYSFTGGTDGGLPYYATITCDAAGNLYGTTVLGGAANAGVVFKVDPAGHETVLYSFGGGADGEPYAGVTLDSAGNLYGSTANGGSANEGTVYRIGSSGNKSTLYSFPAMADGADPYSALVRDPKGNFYGTTESGGPFNSGVVYKMDTKGNETVLYSFTGGADGAYPQGGVILDTAGNLYGTTFSGGPSGAGVVFKLDPTGHETVLHGFSGGADGANPTSGVILDSFGNLYGTTYYGGTVWGTVFKLDPNGHETVLWSFTGGNDGAEPAGGLVRDSAGNLYGTTTFGGKAGFAGVVFKLTPQGSQTVLYNFSDGLDGGRPEATLVLDQAGNLYGTTYEGGGRQAGTVFKVDPTGHQSVLYTFSDGADGGFPAAGVIQDSAGNLYGTTTSGGGTALWAGVVYKLDTAGNETVLHTFTGGRDGDHPSSGLAFDAAGNLYGTTTQGGLRATGVIYQVKP